MHSIPFKKEESYRGENRKRTIGEALTDETAVETAGRRERRAIVKIVLEAILEATLFILWLAEKQFFREKCVFQICLTLSGRYYARVEPVSCEKMYDAFIFRLLSRRKHGEVDTV